MNRKSSRKYSRGFNLLELMVTLSIVAIVVSIALPSMSNMIDSTRMSGYANSLHKAISVARSEAIKRGLPVTICTSNSSQTDCGNSSGWEQGWIVREVNTVIGRDPIILIYQPLKSGFTFHGDSTINTSNIVFTASGTTSGSGTLVLCRDDTVDKNTKSVVLNRFGNVSVRDTTRFTPAECY